MGDFIRGNTRQRNRYLSRQRERYKDVVNTEGESSENAKKLKDEIYRLDKELKVIANSTGTTYNNASYTK